MSWWDGAFKDESMTNSLERGHSPPDWMTWTYWGNESDPDVWPYNPICRADHWWQQRGFDLSDEEPTQAPAEGLWIDWLPSSWSGRLRYLTAPYWALSIIFALAPALVTVRSMRRKRRKRAGCCLNCGYDLRATPDRCPECGLEVLSRHRNDEGTRDRIAT